LAAAEVIDFQPGRKATSRVENGKVFGKVGGVGGVGVAPADSSCTFNCSRRKSHKRKLISHLWPPIN